MSEHPGLEFAPPPIAAFPNFTLDAPSSVIYNLYAPDHTRKPVTETHSFSKKHIRFRLYWARSQEHTQTKRFSSFL